ncbi:MAG: hypothetical protein OEZ68_17325 [Gammaproteobacteria bacterium]|nr:hypothetical protein [Gammaproteobacteria bacterium]MDH5802565.1 hypothetical protein [Gammaproteobacteria bacterium]
MRNWIKTMAIACLLISTVHITACSGDSSENSNSNETVIKGRA